MGVINDFAAQQFGAALRPGEQLELMGIGAVYRKDQPTYAVLGATTQRLLVLECPADAWMNAPEPKPKATMSFEYAALGEVGAGPASGMLGPAKRLGLKGGGGELNVVLMEATKNIGNKWNYTGFDDHREFYDVYPEWLARHVAGGSLRSPQGSANALAELAQARTSRAQRAQQAQQAAVASKAAASIKWPYVLMAFALLGAGLGGFIQFRGADNASLWEKLAEDTHEKAKTKGEYLHDHPEQVKTSLADEQRHLDDAKSTVTMGIGVSIGGGVAAVAFLALGIVLNKKKRARLAAARPG